MTSRRNPLLNGHIYHIFTKSIAGFKIFKSNLDYERIKNLFKYYRIQNAPLKYSAFVEIKNKEEFNQNKNIATEYLVEIIAYCCMTTHIHLILKQLKKDGISIFMGNVLNSYTRYFNNKTKRKGPLWESRFKNVVVESDEQLLHLTRYIHLNPTTANLVNEPHDWKFSSYKEFLGEIQEQERICNYSECLNIDPSDYKEFVTSRISIQQELSKIKGLCLE